MEGRLSRRRKRTRKRMAPHQRSSLRSDHGAGLTNQSLYWPRHEPCRDPAGARLWFMATLTGLLRRSPERLALASDFAQGYVGQAARGCASARGYPSAFAKASAGQAPLAPEPAGSHPVAREGSVLACQAPPKQSQARFGASVPRVEHGPAPESVAPLRTRCGAQAPEPLMTNRNV